MIKFEGVASLNRVDIKEHENCISSECVGPLVNSAHADKIYATYTPNRGWKFLRILFNFCENHYPEHLGNFIGISSFEMGSIVY